MKVTRYNRGYAVRLTESEMEILMAMESMTTLQALWDRLSANQRKSLSRRYHQGSLFRTDEDKRKGQ